MHQKMDPDKLFETMTVEEVKHMLQETRLNIERKKEELRFLVGERYRDIIEAADTISEMKMSAEKINGSLNRLNEVCQNWHKEIYLDDRISASDTSHEVSVEHSCNPKYSVAAQVKLLLHMPELLWSAVERHDHSRAAVLYLSSRHVFTHLQLGGEMQLAKVNALPLVTRQWNSLMQFREVVVRGARLSMRKGFTPETQICDALVSLILLNDLSLEQVFEEYLNARKSAIEECANCEDSSTTVKRQISAGLELLLSTVRQLHDLFIPDEDGFSLLQKMLDQSVSETLISNSDLDENIFSYLPSTVSQFRPSLSHIKDKLTAEYIRRSTTKWFNSCMDFFGPAVRSLISHISALKSLNGIREGICSTLVTITQNDSAWKSASEVVLDSRVDLWSGYLKAIFMERLEVVMKNSFTAIFDWLAVEVTAVASMEQEDGSSPPLDNFDLNVWLWSEQTADVSVDAVWSAGARHLTGDLNPLGRKFSCFTPAVQNVAAALNERLQKLLEDLSMDSLSAEEKSEVQTLMTSAVQSCLEKFLDWVTSQSAAVIVLPAEASRPRVIFYSRLCQALVDICPALRRCLDPAPDRPPALPGRALRPLGPGPAKAAPCAAAWQAVAAMLTRASCAAAESWLNRICDANAAAFLDTLQSFQDVMAFLELCPRWDEIKLEGASVRIPSHASWHVHKLLSNICQELNACGAHSMSRTVLLTCINHLSSRLLKTLHDFFQENRDSLGQPQTLQLLFDVRFLFCMLSTSHPDLLDGLLRDLESVIDPFDLDVASGPMQASISQLCARCTLVYGLIVGLHDRLGALAAVGSSSSANPIHDEHHLLARCGGTSMRFVPLPSSGTVRMNLGAEAETAKSGGPVGRGKKGSSRKSYTLF